MQPKTGGVPQARFQHQFIHDVYTIENHSALDHPSARDGVDPRCVGCAALSGGGLPTCYLAGLDDRNRCACCVKMIIYLRYHILNSLLIHSRIIYVPGLPPDLDYPEILGLHAFGTTLVLNDGEAQLFTLAEMHRADRVHSEGYSKARAADRYHCTFYPGPHKVDRLIQEEAFAWFVRWLKP